MRDQHFEEIANKGEFVVWVAGITPPEDEEQQLANRLLFANIDESEEQDDRVHKFQMDVYCLGDELNVHEDEFQIARVSHELVAASVDKVIVPYGPHINWPHKSDRRLFPLFLALIKASAKWHQFQRLRGRDGEIIANLTDFQIAKWVWTNIQSTSIAKVNSTDLEILDVISEIRGDDGYGNPGECASTIRSIKKEIDRPYTTIQSSLKRLYDAGFVDYEKIGRVNKYWQSSKNITTLRNVTIQDFVTKNDNRDDVNYDITKKIEDVIGDVSIYREKLFTPENFSLSPSVSVFSENVRYDYENNLRTASIDYENVTKPCFGTSGKAVTRTSSCTPDTADPSRLLSDIHFITGDTLPRRFHRKDLEDYVGFGGNLLSNLMNQLNQREYIFEWLCRNACFLRVSIYEAGCLIDNLVSLNDTLKWYWKPVFKAGCGLGGCVAG